MNPSHCDVCQRLSNELKVMIDGKTQMGQWGYLCENCHKEVGCGLGTGKGQKYAKQPDGTWKKIEG